MAMCPKFMCPGVHVFCRLCVLVSMCPIGFRAPGSCDNEEEELSITSCAC